VLQLAQAQGLAADGERQEHQPEPVAEGGRVGVGAQVDRDHGAHVHPRRHGVVPRQVAVERPGDRREQYVVDRAGEGLPGAAHVIERNGVRPGDQLLDAEPALEPGLRIEPHEGELAQRGRCAAERAYVARRADRLADGLGDGWGE
jgi:hypothetical protein